MAAVAAFVLLMVAGLGLFARSLVQTQGVVEMAASSTPRPTGQPTALSQVQRRDALAAEAMLEVSAADSRSGEPAMTPGVEIAIPVATRNGTARVPTGFPHTPEGAVGQLAAIEVAVLQAMSVRRTIEVHQGWADPSAGSAAGWRLTENVRDFLTAAQMGQQKDLTATVTVTPAAGQVKGTDGPDWVVACVLVDVRAVIAVEQRMAYGYCERMQWTEGRWMIAPGAPPSTAPSTWPGTELAVEAGWQTWRNG